jgi:hypothetical protein
LGPYIYIYIYIYTIQRIKNSRRNRDSGSPHPKKFKTQKSSSKVLASVFRDKDRILPVDFLEKSTFFMAKYCVALPDKLKQHLVS